MSRWGAGVLAVFFALWSILLPVTVSAATYNAASNLTGRAWVVPAVGTGLAGSAIVATASTILGRANPWIAALTIGTPIMKQLMELKSGNQQVAVTARDALQETPAGWTDSEHPPASAGPLSTSTQSATAQQPRWHGDRVNGNTGATNSNYYDGATASEVGGPMCQYRASTLVPAQTGTFTGFNADYVRADCSFSSWGAGNSGGTMSQYCPTGSASGASPNVTCVGGTYTCPNGGTLSGTQCLNVPTCPAGYSPSGATCTLTNASAVKWPSDGLATLRLNGAGIELHPRDPDVLPSPATTTEFLNPSQDYAPDPLGQPASSTYTPTADGGYTWTQNLQTTINNQTYTTTNQITVNGSGVLQKASTATNNGPIGTASPTPALQLPDDYNREVTQQKILTGADAQNAPDFSSQVTTAKEQADQELKTKIEEIPGQFGTDKGNWFSWVWTPPVGACSPWSSTIHGQSVSINICPWVEKIRDVVGWLFVLFGAWTVYNEMFRRNDA